MAKKQIFWGILALVLVLGLAIVSCAETPANTDNTDATKQTKSDAEDGDGADTETDYEEAFEATPDMYKDELSERTYFDLDKKIVFGRINNRAGYTVYSVKRGKDFMPVLDAAGKYTYTVSQTGWRRMTNTASQTIHIEPEKVALPTLYGGFDDTLLTKPEYKTAMWELITQTKLSQGVNRRTIYSDYFGARFFTPMDYLDYLVEDAFKLVKYHYAFSTDNKALFLDKPLPENRGDNDLFGKTYYGMTAESTALVKDMGQTYMFKDGNCIYNDTNSGFIQMYTYAYDSDATPKRLFLKRPIADRQMWYDTLLADSPTAGFFANTDDYKAAMTNSTYNAGGEYTYNSATQTVQGARIKHGN